MRAHSEEHQVQLTISASKEEPTLTLKQWKEKDRLARKHLLRNMSNEIKIHFQNPEFTAPEIWAKAKEMYDHTDLALVNRELAALC